MDRKTSRTTKEAAPHAAQTVDLPPMWKLADIARHLRMYASSLVEASARGQFVPLVQIGRTWFARRADVLEWFAKTGRKDISPLALDRVRAAGAEACRQHQSRRRQPRARSAASC